MKNSRTALQVSKLFSSGYLYIFNVLIILDNSHNMLNFGLGSMGYSSPFSCFNRKRVQQFSRLFFFQTVVLDPPSCVPMFFFFVLFLTMENE